MEDLGRNYISFIFIASIGVIQLAAVHAGLTKLLFIKSKALTYFLGLTLIAAGFTWFFWDGPHHIPDTAGGLDGNDQAARFALSALAAVSFTVLISSMLNRRTKGRPTPTPDGLESLRDNTYLEALPTGLRSLWKERPSWMQR